MIEEPIAEYHGCVFDSHCHLTDIGQPDQVLREAWEAGVTSLLTVGYDDASNRAVLALKRQFSRLPIAVGLHPWYAASDLRPVLELIAHTVPEAVGEVGLDLWPDPALPGIGRQIEVLEAQLDLALRLDLPVTLHSRKAAAELWAVVQGFPGLRGALHAFGGSLEQAELFVGRGFLVGVGGGVTRSRARRMRRTAAGLPLESLLVETDAPAIGMEGVEPPEVRPKHLPRVVAALAELRGMDPLGIEQATDENARRLFGPRVAIGLSAHGWNEEAG